MNGLNRKLLRLAQGAFAVSLATAAQAELITLDLSSVTMGDTGYPLSGSVTIDTETGLVTESTVTSPTETYTGGRVSGSAVVLTGVGGGELLLDGPEFPGPGEAFLGLSYNLTAPQVVEFAPGTFDLLGVGGPPDFLWEVVVSGNAPILPGSVPDPGPAATSVITGDQFTLSADLGDQPLVAADGIAGSAGTDIRVDEDNTEYSAEWVDENTVDIRFGGGFGTFTATDISFTLSDLDFSEDGEARAITGVSYNRFASGVNDFLGDFYAGQPLFSDFVEPVITFDDTSFTATFSTFHYVLIADQISQIYDITTEVVDTPAAVPLPATAPLLLLGLAGAFGLRRSRKN